MGIDDGFEAAKSQLVQENPIAACLIEPIENTVTTVIITGKSAWFFYLQWRQDSGTVL
jgi:hypothetical protein